MRSATAKSAREEVIAVATRLFGERGIEATSLREVARASEVSPALLVHHFGGKEGLVAAVDEAAVLAFGRAYDDEGDSVDAAGDDLLRRRATQTAAVMRQRPELCAYIGRALVDGTPGSRRLFRSMIEGGRAEIEALAEQGALRPDADPLWVTLQHFFLIWAPLSFTALLDEALDGPLLDEERFDRWVEANVQLLREGVYR